MTPEAIVAILTGLSPVPDRTPKHDPIPRSLEVSQAISAVCADTSTWALCALNLDVLVYQESGGLRYVGTIVTPRHEIAGDCPGMRAGDWNCTREKGARSCGPFQTRCIDTPKGATLIEQTRIAWRILERAAIACPMHPLWAYASGECKWSKTAEDYEKIVAKHASEVPP